MRVVTVVGTRPEAIKMAPVVREAKRRGIDHILLATGQQRALFDDAIAAFGLSVDHHLGDNLGGAAMADQMAAIADAVGSFIAEARSDWVLVQGDTNTALAGARAAASLGIAVAHIEAGLRSFDLDRPFPEERNRIEIAKLATLHCAPCDGAAANLRAEAAAGTILVTGNPGIDAMTAMCAAPPEIPGPNLVTCHRRENFGAPLDAICLALRTIADAGVRMILPVHSNPAVAMPIRAALGDHPHIALIDPLDYPAMIAAIRAAPFVISDSGGLQEECAALGVPLLLMREETERPEVVASGNCILVGSDPVRIVAEATRLRDDLAHHAAMSVPSFPYGNGDAAPRIVDALLSCDNPR